MSRRTLLIDGDVIAYQRAAAAEQEHDWGDGVWTLHADERSTIQSVDKQLDRIMGELDGTRMVVCLTDGTNWRKDVYPEYKSNRKDRRRPMLLPRLREYMLEKYETFLRPRLEADDIMGILMTHPRLPKGKTGEKIVVTIDKDLHTIPGLHWNWTKDGGPTEVDEDEANISFLTQALSGDPTDGYPGCPGLGPKRSRPVVADAYENGGMLEAWKAIVAEYEKKGLGEEFALSQARCARILRREDYDFKKKEVILWDPKTK